MYIPLGVRERQGTGNLAQDGECRFRRHSLADTRLEIAARDVLHGEVVIRAGDADVIYCIDVRMREFGNDLGLAYEALAERGIGRPELRKHDLERHFAFHALLNREINVRHAAAPKLAHDSVTRDLDINLFFGHAAPRYSQLKWIKCGESSLIFSPQAMTPLPNKGNSSRRRNRSSMSGRRM